MITNIGTLQSAVESWLERTFDDSLFLEWSNDVAGSLIRGVMGPDNRTWACPPLRTRDMLTTGTLTTSGASVALPTGWLEFQRLWIDDSSEGKDLLYLPLSQFKTNPYSQLTGTPTHYTIEGDTLYVLPTTDDDIEVSYFTTLGAFTGDSSTDTILTSDPGVYRMGVMAEACDWIGDFARADRERMKMYARVKGLNQQFANAQVSGTIPIARAMVAP